MRRRPSRKRRKGHNPSPASVYRALAEHARLAAHPDAAEQARAEFASTSSSATSPAGTRQAVGR